MIEKQNRPIIIGVAGGSGSGKTYFAREVKAAFGDELCEIVYQDNFYIDQSRRFDHDGGSVNFDHPNSIDFARLCECLRELKTGQATKIPVYDFVSHSRQANTLPIAAKRVIIVDGILIFHPPSVREVLDEMIFFETSEALRFQRRLDRDVKERGRTPDGVRSQFERQVKPMHDEFVEPSKAHAHSIVKDTEEYAAFFAQFIQKLRQKLGE